MSSSDQTAQQIFAEALDVVDTVERSAFLDRACGGREELRREVQSLLAANSAAGEFLQRPAPAGAGAQHKTMFIPPLSEKQGTRIGRYKLLEQIGEGGFGVVWMAEQEEPVRRRVALKVIKLGMDTKEVVARFEAERQALAMMDHPHIASVFDGGATDTGRPYFVMELVKGLPITEYCDANKLSTRERLELFMQVCRAVQHAHQKGIIHRDLKPSNILVTQQDDKPVPKVIDFGVAKATQTRLTEKTFFTQFRQWIGTPAYMSPEQAGLGSLDVDTRSDIYSLGVLLYELLTGRTPFDTAKLLEQGYEAVMRTIREEEPPKPSTRLSTLNKEDLSTVAAKRSVEPTKLSRLVNGDLDWVVMKALEKDRTRRYDTANDLARDAQHFLREEPVSAAAPNLAYRTGKFVRRNRTRLAFSLLAAAVLALAVAGLNFALSFRSAERAFQATGTNLVFTLARNGDARALARLLDANPRLANERNADGSTPLLYAAGNGSTNTLRLLLARGAAVDATNNNGLTPLGHAAANNQRVAVSELLEAGADPNQADSSGVTPLHAAAWYGSVEMGQALLDKGARVDVPNRGTRLTPLHQAAVAGYADFVDLLLAHHAQAELRDSSGNTPLHLAAHGRNVAGLIGDWKQKLSSLNDHEKRGQEMAAVAEVFSNRLVQIEALVTPAVLRAGGQHARVAALLIAHGADQEATNADVCTPLLTAAMFTNLPVAEVLVGHQARLNVRAKDGSPPLNLAALNGSVPVTELLLGAGASVDLQDNSGFTPLNTAIEHDHPDVARILLGHGANPNLAELNGQTPMHTAAARGDIASLRLLLEGGASLHSLETAGTPLSLAAQHHQVETVKFLLQRGAKPDVAAPQNGMTTLHWAAALGHPDIVKLLLEAGAIVDADSSCQGAPLNAAAAGRNGARKWLASLYAQSPADANVTHLALGSEEDYVAVLRMLLAAKANVNAREPTHSRSPLFLAVNQAQLAAVEILLAADADVKATDRMGMTPLHAASEMEAPTIVVSNIVRRLLRAGADVEARDQFRGTPLHAAANAGNPVLVTLLLEAGARINALGPNLCTPLQLAVMRGRREVVQLLLARHPDLEWRNSYGTAALHQAAQLQETGIAALLLDHGAEVDSGTTNGATALMVSATTGNLRMMELLVARGARIEAETDNGATPFLVAAETGQVESARWLLQQGAKFDVVDRTGFTPLLMAAHVGSLPMAQFLVERGAPINVHNKVGFTPLHDAADRGHAELAAWLLDHGATIDPTDDYSATPLHMAAHGAFADESRYVAVVKVLTSRGADVNARMRWKQTPLHRAAVWGHPDILRALLDAGADRTLRDADGKTALDLASASGESELRAEVDTGRKKCAVLLRGNKVSQRPDLFHQATQGGIPGIGVN